MQGVEQRQVKLLQQRKEIIIEKRRRRAEREGAEGSGPSTADGASPGTATAGVLGY